MPQTLAAQSLITTHSVAGLSRCFLGKTKGLIQASHLALKDKDGFIGPSSAMLSLGGRSEQAWIVTLEWKTSNLSVARRVQVGLQDSVDILHSPVIGVYDTHSFPSPLCLLFLLTILTHM